MNRVHLSIKIQCKLFISFFLSNSGNKILVKITKKNGEVFWYITVSGTKGNFPNMSWYFHSTTSKAQTSVIAHQLSKNRLLYHSELIPLQADVQVALGSKNKYFNANSFNQNEDCISKLS